MIVFAITGAFGIGIALGICIASDHPPHSCDGIIHYKFKGKD